MPERALTPDDDAGRPPRGGAKHPGAFRTISEVAEDLDVPQHVLRFWETRFPQVKPLKRGGGRRYYRPEDVALLRGIRHLLYSDGYTIKGVQKVLRENGAQAVIAVAKPLAERLADHRAHAPVVSLPPPEAPELPEPPEPGEPHADEAPEAPDATPTDSSDLESSPPAGSPETARDTAYWRALVLDLRRELAELRDILRDKTKA